MDSLVHRPRNVGWRRAAGLLYGDWGTSKAYVLGLAFTCPVAGASGYHSLSIIMAVCALTALVGYNYSIVCRLFPDGGGVYSAARDQSRLLAVLGALLLIANFTVTAAMSCWAGMAYFGISKESIRLCALGMIMVVGIVNYFGPKHSGSLAVSMALPTVVVVFLITALSLPHLTTANLEPPPAQFNAFWLAFTWSILALSGVEAIANLTGVMKLDPGMSMERPKVGATAQKAIFIVAVEVVVGTILLGWAMLSLPKSMEPVLRDNYEQVMRIIGQEYGTLTLGPRFGEALGITVGVVVGILLLSAVNTAISALIGLFYMMARDGEMPKSFARLNGFGVPWIPLGLAVLLPLIVTAVAEDLEALAGLYAIGVVGAIAVNLGSCTFNKRLALRWYQRGVMGVTFLVLFAVELTIAKTRQDALFFACIVIASGLALRAWAQRRAGLRTLTVTEQVAASVAPEIQPEFRLNLNSDQIILVAARGMTPVLRFAMEEASLRKASLYVLYVKELAVTLPSALPGGDPPRWQADKQALAIMYPMLELGRQHDVTVIPLYTVSENPATTILDLTATLGVDLLILGATHRRTLVRLLKGDVVTQVAHNLPENIQLLIYG